MATTTTTTMSVARRRRRRARARDRRGLAYRLAGDWLWHGYSPLRGSFVVSWTTQPLGMRPIDCSRARAGPWPCAGRAVSLGTPFLPCLPAAGASAWP